MTIFCESAECSTRQKPPKGRLLVTQKHSLLLYLRTICWALLATALARCVARLTCAVLTAVAFIFTHKIILRAVNHHQWYTHLKLCKVLPFSFERNLLRTGSVSCDLVWLEDKGHFVCRDDERAEVLGI